MENVQMDVNDLENLNDEEFLLLYHVAGSRNKHLSLPLEVWSISAGGNDR